jgi:hypothetical protein
MTQKLSSPTVEVTTDEPDAVAAAQKEIDKTRAVLGETVDELAARADVKQRMKEKVHGVRMQVAEQRRQLVTAGRQQNWLRPGTVAAALGLCASVLVGRRLSGHDRNVTRRAGSRTFLSPRRRRRGMRRGSRR